MKNLPTIRGPKGMIRLNNAATTPPFIETIAAVNEFLETYGAFHRGAGPLAAATYHKTSEAIQTLRRFLNVGDHQSLLFTQNTSSAINLFIRLLDLKTGDIILTSMLEHTSNNLPWTYNSRGRVVYTRVFDDGSLDYADLEKNVRQHRARLKLIAITGASNLSGYIPDIPRIAGLAHSAGALLFVDAAQLAPHRPIDMTKSKIDALAFSAHKVYAPFGLGVLALPSQLLERQPVDPGGGSIDMITEKNTLWAPAASRHQTGTWNVTGIIAAAASCKRLMETGWTKIIRHEQDLVRYMARQLATVPNLELYISPEHYLREDRIGTFTFNLKGYHSALLGSILENEYSIETRAGTICNHRLVRRWFKISDAQQAAIEREIRHGNRLASYGIVRASLAVYNTPADIDALVEALKAISKNGPRLTYRPVPEEEIYEVAEA